MFTSTAVALLLDLRKLARNVRGVTVQHRRVAVADLPRVVQHDHLWYTISSYTLFYNCYFILNSWAEIISTLRCTSERRNQLVY